MTQNLKDKTTKHLNDETFKRPNIQTTKHLNDEAFKRRNIQTMKRSDFSKSECDRVAKRSKDDSVKMCWLQLTAE